MVLEGPAIPALDCSSACVGTFGWIAKLLQKVA
jgi:hypothetical protein